ncbi:histidine kinase [uncultured Croceitalea sp.]|uniref:sensor histidine kinase n=1 Tax=uncultured Croceitalea sp. TaxID=1798908 RepID=UPI0033065D28
MASKHNILNKTLFGKIQFKEVLAVFLIYSIFSWLYRFVLWYNGGWYEKEGIWGWMNLEGYWFASGMSYTCYFFASIIIWVLGVQLLRKKHMIVQVIAVLILIPIIIYITRELRYVLIDYMGRPRLQGTGEIWDWYIPLLFLMIQFGFFFAYRYFKENQKKMEIEGELRQAALKSELAAIKAQLNPHFLYNVFNTINASVPSKMEETRHLIATLSDLFRYQLKASKKELVPLGEELEFVNKYLELEKARFEDRLQIEINVPEELLCEQVPPMLLQPLVENSVKHGISESLKGGKISISVFRDKGKLKFEIADTGKGVTDKNGLFGKGVGLSNTRMRLQKMYQTQLELIDNEPQGLKICFAI